MVAAAFQVMTFSIGGFEFYIGIALFVLGSYLVLAAALGKNGWILFFFLSLFE